MVGTAACTQALLGHISTGQATTAEAMAAAGESGSAGHELVYLQVMLMRICVLALRAGVPPLCAGVAGNFGSDVRVSILVRLFCSLRFFVSKTIDGIYISPVHVDRCLFFSFRK